MAVFKRWNGTSWEVIGPTISNSRVNTVEELIAPEYDSNSSYSVGDFVIYSDTLYKCNTAIGSGGELWNSAHWTETKIGNEVSDLKSAINTIIDIEESVNLYNKDSILNQSNKWIRSTGDYETLNNSSVSHPIKVTKGKSYTYSYYVNFYGLDNCKIVRNCESNGTLKMGGYTSTPNGTTSGTFTALSDGYVCINVYTPQKYSYMFVEGNLLPEEYTPYKETEYILGESVQFNDDQKAYINANANDTIIDVLKCSEQNPTYVPSITWVNRTIDANGDLGNVASDRAATEDMIDVAGYSRMTWVATQSWQEKVFIHFFDNKGEHIGFGSFSSPYYFNNPKISKIRILLGASINIDASQVGNIIVLTKQPPVRTSIEELPLSPSNKTVMLIGDSITQGYGSTGFVIYDTIIDGVTYSVRGNGPDYPSAGQDYQVGTYLYARDRRIWYEALSGDGWAQKLKAYYEEKFNCTVLNYGMSGIDSSDVSSFRSNLIINSNADIVIMMIGTNDRGNTPLDTFYNRIYKTGQLIIQSGKKLILMAPIPASVSNESAFSRHIEDYEHVLYKIARLLNCKFISMYELFMDYCDLRGITIDSLLGDGLHPNDEGYEVMFKLITKELGLNRKRPGATW